MILSLYSSFQLYSSSHLVVRGGSYLNERKQQDGQLYLCNFIAMRKNGILDSDSAGARDTYQVLGTFGKTAAMEPN